MPSTTATGTGPDRPIDRSETTDAIKTNLRRAHPRTLDALAPICLVAPRAGPPKREVAAMPTGKPLLIQGGEVAMERRDRDSIGKPGSVPPSTGPWRSIEASARILGVPTITLRRLIGRSARRASDGSVEACIDGIRARKLGRQWRVWRPPSWTGPVA
jgi:hypothetical protein